MDLGTATETLLGKFRVNARTTEIADKKAKQQLHGIVATILF
jgi:hypothetical protein